MTPQLAQLTQNFVMRIWREYLTVENPVLEAEVKNLDGYFPQLYSGMDAFEHILWDGCLKIRSSEEQA